VNTPPTLREKRALRRRRQRIRIAIELAAGVAAIGFVLHPVAFPRLRGTAVVADSAQADSLDDANDTTATLTGSGLSTRASVASRLLPKGRLFRSVEERARLGERIAVSVTAYCLQGRTRRGNLVRDGIIAVDRKLFPLGRDVDLFFGRAKYGRFLADDTGGAIKGAIIDVWMSDCNAARRFGRRRGYAQLVRHSE
jgi:3D (Asp-Asp-Asp) domain-containing protein